MASVEDDAQLGHDGTDAEESGEEVELDNCETPSLSEADDNEDSEDSAAEEEEGEGDGAEEVKSSPGKTQQNTIQVPPHEVPISLTAEVHVRRVPGPIERLIMLGNDCFNEATIPWEEAEDLRFDRETALLVADAKPKSAKGAKSAKSAKGKGNEVDVVDEPEGPSPAQLLQQENAAAAKAKHLFARCEKFYLRALNQINMSKTDRNEHEFYPVTCLNIGECCLRQGEDEAAKKWIGPIVSLIDIPGRMTGAMMIAAQDLLLEPGHTWWSSLFPPPRKSDKTKKKKGKSKVGVKKKKKGGKKKT